MGASNILGGHDAVLGMVAAPSLARLWTLRFLGKRAYDVAHYLDLP